MNKNITAVTPGNGSCQSGVDSKNNHVIENTANENLRAAQFGELFHALSQQRN
jgi:hypothetical protein